MEKAPSFSFGKIWVLGFGFLGVSLIWTIYNDFIPILLQAGRPDFSKGAGVRGYGLGPGATGLIMGLDNLAAIFILPYVGALSDRTRTPIGRRKPFLLAGAPVAAAAFAAVPLTLGMPLPFFMAAIIVMLLAMDLFRTPVVALMPDLTPPSLRSPANGVINFMGGLGTVFAGIAGGFAFKLSPAAPFWLGSAGMLAAIGVVLLTVREPERPEEPEEAPPSLLHSLRTVLKDRDRSAVRLLCAICFWFLGQSALDAWFTSFAMTRLALDPGSAATLKAAFSTAYLLAALPSGAAGARWGRQRTILAGLVVMAVAIGGMAGVRSVEWMRPVLVLAGLAWSVVVVNSLPLVLDFAPEGREGSYTGLYYLASQTAAWVGPMVSGYVFEGFRNDYGLLCVWAPAALAMAAALMQGVRRRPDSPAT